MKQKRIGLIIANVLPVVILFGEIALLAMHLTGWAIGISIAIAVVSFIIFCRHPYGEETIFFVANLGYMLTILVSIVLNNIDSTVSIFAGILLGIITCIVQGFLTDNRIQGRI